MKYLIGLGKTGVSVSQYLLRHNIPFIVWDDTPALQEKAQLMGCSVVAPDKAPWHIIEEMILSPGIPTAFPTPHPAVAFAKKYVIPFRGDVDYWYQTIQHLGCKYIGTTGTNGKSTTHAIIEHVLKTAGISVFSGGNSGFPVFDAQDLTPQSVINLEMSSYQLDILKNMEFDAGILLNITPDHLDRHGSIENYIVSKQIQIEHVKAGGLKVIGIDTLHSRQAYNSLLAKGHTDVIPISTSDALTKGVYAQGRQVYSTENKAKLLLGVIPDTLPGAHNAQNAMAAMLVCRFLGVDTSIFFKMLASYCGLEHRQERVLDTSKILAINDSKATNADATLPALNTYPNIYWIAGGIAKEAGLVPLLPHLQNVEKILLIGRSVERFSHELKGLEEKTYITDTLDDALEMVAKDLKTLNHKITLLFSPACASQDQFESFEHRGQVFKALIQKRFGAH